MGKNPDNIIKGRIAETIVEEMFRELGFYVIKMGQEHTINPLVQLENFVKNCNGNFKINKGDFKTLDPIDYARTLPDFFIVDKKGNVNLLEVKFRSNATIREERDCKVFYLYPNTLMLIVNLSVSDEFIKKGIFSQEDIESMKKTRFHVWTRHQNEGKTNVLGFEPLSEWLKKTNDYEPKEVIEKYENLVEMWLKPAKKEKWNTINGKKK